MLAGEPAPSSVVSESPFEAADARIERRILLLAPPITFGFALLLMQLDTWRMLARTFLTMWVHELGHTVAAWFSGRFAVPGPWVTRLGEGRSVFVVLALAALIAWIGYRGWCANRRWQIGLAVVAMVVQLLCTFGQGGNETDAFITFLGDGGMLILGAVLMLTFWSPPGSYMHRHWLRWGFLVIGAFAYIDALMTWWQARADRMTIAYGEIEGVGHSDPTKLVFDHNWAEPTMIRRYLWLAAICLTVVAARYAWSQWRQRHVALLNH